MTQLEDPLLMKDYVGRYVKIKTREGTDYAGWVFTVDPVTNSFIIVHPSQEQSKELKCVLGHAIINVTVMDNGEIPASCSEMLHQFVGDDAATRLSAAELLIKKEKIVSWFQRNLIPVSASQEDDMVLVVMKVLQISPPYRACDCFGDNEIILGKIQGILESMPEEISEI